VPGLGSVAEVHAVAPPLVAHRLAGREVARIAGARSCRLLHSHSLETGYVTAIAARSSGLRWLHTEHSTEWTDQRSAGLVGAYVGMTKRAIARADSCTAVSEYLAAAMAEGGVKGPVDIVPNVVDLDRPARRISTSLGPRDPIRVLSVGLLNDMKRPLLAVEAFAEFAARRPGSTMTWIGAGPLEAAVRQRTSELDLEGLVTVFPPMAQEPYRRTMAEHDLLLLPSRYETFSVVAAEALAAGLPVVMGNRGGHTGFVTPQFGVLVEGDTAAAYSGGLERAAGLLAQPTAHFRSAAEGFTAARVREAFATAYERLGVVG
jgi:glycosyltransferase involved in cell wall biosynthesis